MHGQKFQLMKTACYKSAAMKARICEMRDRLYRVALTWCGDAMLADDLVQQSITASIDNRHSLRDPDKLVAWVFTILRNTWHQHLRKQKLLHEFSDDVATKDSGPCHTCESQELVEQVRYVVSTLPEDQRQVLSLVDLEELSYCEVAQILDIPVGTVMSRLHRARKTLLARMQQLPKNKTHPSPNIHLVES